MEKIERYLDQACRGIAGPRASATTSARNSKNTSSTPSLRAQIRRPLRRRSPRPALEDFGGPDLVRSELEATHGHRLMTLVLDKALQWKEKTISPLALDFRRPSPPSSSPSHFKSSSPSASSSSLFPRLRELVFVGVIADGPSTGIVRWSMNYLSTTASIIDNVLCFLIPLAIVWALFEWRVRSENKSFIRLSVLGLFSVGLMVAALFTTAAISLPFFIVLNLNSTSEGSEHLVAERVNRFDHLLAQIDQSASAADWPALQGDAQQLFDDQIAYPSGSYYPARSLPYNTPAALLLSRHREDILALRHDLRDTRTALQNLSDISTTRDPARIKDALQKLHAAYDPIHRFATPETRPAGEP